MLTMKESSKTDEKPSYLGHRQRLKTRFLKDGGASMPDYEIMELLLTYVLPRRDVKEDAKKLLKHFGSFAGVFEASDADLENYGFTQNMIAFFNVVAAAHKRIAHERLQATDNAVYSNFDYILDYCRSAVLKAEVEEFHVLMFDAKLHLIKDALMQRGSLNSVAVYVREVVKEVISQKACSVVLFHNHPSGDCRPSKHDLDITKEIIQALKLMQVKVQDHLIISQNDYYSFHDHRLVDFMDDFK